MSSADLAACTATARDGLREQDTVFILVQDESLRPVRGWRLYCYLGLDYNVSWFWLLEAKVCRGLSITKIGSLL